MTYHLTYAEAVVTGLIQGVTELFPVSSLGHNVLLPALIGGTWAKTMDVSSEKSPYLAFVVGLHVATAIAMIAYFWRDWVRIARGFVSSLRTRSATTPDEKLAWMIILATIPVGIVGAVGQKAFTHVFAKPTLAALFLVLNGLILLYSERRKRQTAALAVADVGVGVGVGVGAAAADGRGRWDGDGGVRRGDEQRGDEQRGDGRRGGGRRGVGRDQRREDGHGGWDEAPRERRDEGWGGPRDGQDGRRDRQDGRQDGQDGRGAGRDGGRGTGRDGGRGAGRHASGYPQQPPQGFQQQPQQQQWQGPRPGDDEWRYGPGGNEQYPAGGAGGSGQQDPWAGQRGGGGQYGQDGQYSQYGQDAQYGQYGHDAQDAQDPQYRRDAQYGRGGQADYGRAGYDQAGYGRDGYGQAGYDARYAQDGARHGGQVQPGNPGTERDPWGGQDRRDLRGGGGRHADPRQADPRQGDPRQSDPRQSDPRHADPRHADPRQADPRGAAGHREVPAGRRGGHAQHGGHPGHAQHGGHGRLAESGAETERAVRADLRLSTMGNKRAVIIGAAQIAALLPGISRDGLVTVAGLWRGLSREDAVRFSFLLSAPVILAAGALKAHDLVGPMSKGMHGPIIVGSLLSGIGAYVSIRFLTRYFSEERSLNPFGFYCLAAGLLSLAYLLFVK
jgi:undecaprenyl pyrophosphate phosphatase UppP